MKELMQPSSAAGDNGSVDIGVFYAGDIAAHCSSPHLHRSVDQGLVMASSECMTHLSQIVFVKRVVKVAGNEGDHKLCCLCHRVCMSSGTAV